MTFPRPGLTCQHVVELVTDYLEGALEANERAHLEQHLLICEPCDVYIQQIKATSSALRASAANDPHPHDPHAETHSVAPEAARQAALSAFRKLKAGKP